MRLDRERRASRATVMAAVGRQLRDSWSSVEVGPIPDGLARLASRLEQQGQFYFGREGRIAVALRDLGDRQMKSRIKRKRLLEMRPEEREVLEAAATSAGCPVEELNIDLILDQARVLGEL